ncbi:hypothetical protein KJ359_010061 [Pestalotiopsis sp. 9143b]|nr:hypothetical protein KJ359_010061 [Pestalotiopsis sp. 9143b]
MSKSALVFGASGVTGWAFVNEILHDYPKEGIWSRVHALTNRPLAREASLWPDDARLNIASGIDLLAGSQQDLENTLQENIPDIESATHVFYLAYKAQGDVDAELEENVAMFRRATTALDHLSPALEFVSLQTGAKHYGCHLLENHPTDDIHVPLAESMPRLKQPHHDKLFYYPQLDWLKDYAADKKWYWNDTRPDIIIGFVPNQNFYSLGTVLGVYLSLWRELHGKGAECPFPGTTQSWKALSIDSSSDMIARQTLHVTLTPPWSERKGEAFNVADARTPSSWETKWPALCSYFGLKSIKLEEDNPVEVRSFIKANLGIWETMEKKYKLPSGHADNPRTVPGFEYFLLTQFDFDRQYDMSKMYGTGFTEERSTSQAWGCVFDRMREAKIIPANFT